MPLKVARVRQPVLRLRLQAQEPIERHLRAEGRAGHNDQRQHEHTPRHRRPRSVVRYMTRSATSCESRVARYDGISDVWLMTNSRRSALLKPLRFWVESMIWTENVLWLRRRPVTTFPDFVTARTERYSECSSALGSRIDCSSSSGRRSTPTSASDGAVRD